MRKIIIRFYCLRHGHPNDKETDLDELGGNQVRATIAAHLRGVHFRFAATSEMQRALTSLMLILGDSQSVVTHKDQREIGYEWLLKDPRLPVPTTGGRRKPKTAFELVALRPQSLLLGHIMWEHLVKLAKYELWMQFYGKAMTEDDARRTIECNALVAGHSGVIEAMAAAAANQAVPLKSIPVLGHADILRFTAEWTVDDHEISTPSITAIDHLPCPIKTPA